MTQTVVSTDPAEDLDALFEDIVRGRASGAPAEGGTAPASEASAPVPAAVAEHIAGHDPASCPAEKMLGRIGQMTRTLHENLRELGYDKVLEQAAAAIPDARDRLAYVATMTEQAAQRALNAIEVAQPIQEQLASRAAALGTNWGDLLERKLTLDQFRTLVDDTRGFLAEVPERTAATNAQLLEIMMAQDFQDLTGQVIKKITDIIQTLEQELLELLLENIPAERRSDLPSNLLNGPVVNPQGRSDVVKSQQQVDELLGSLGF